jgi:hypothetical protein
MRKNFKNRKNYLKECAISRAPFIVCSLLFFVVVFAVVVVLSGAGTDEVGAPSRVHAASDNARQSASNKVNSREVIPSTPFVSFNLYILSYDVWLMPAFNFSIPYPSLSRLSAKTPNLVCGICAFGFGISHHFMHRFALRNCALIQIDINYQIFNN